MKVPQTIFREYDIRGTVNTEITEEFARALGQAYAEVFAKELSNGPVAIGYDCRLTSEGLANALAKGIASKGISVTLTGMGPTPQLYYAVYSCGYQGGIQVTGSHNPADMNGFKMCVGKSTLSGDKIQALYQYIKALKDTNAPARAPISNLDLREQYTQELIANSKPQIGGRKLKVVCDAGNGVGGLVGPKLLRALGVEVIELYCDPDGRFPNHHPDPTVPESLHDLVALVKKSGADCGIGWDGDADRIGVVDELGQVVYGDMLTLLYAREILKDQPGALIIGDVKCSSLLFSDVTKRGGRSLMWKTGHSLIKAKLKELDGALAGEMSGHIMFRHRFFGFDDALYASARLVEILSHTSLSLSQLLSDLPKLYSTPEIRVDCPEEKKFSIAEHARELFNKYEVDTTDGARIAFEHGWALVRASNTQPILVMRFEAENQASLSQYQELVTGKIKELILK